VNAIADTGWIVAFRNEDDLHHDWAVSLAPQLTFPVLACESVLAEASFRLQSSALVLEMLKGGILKLAFRLDEHEDHIAELSEDYSDRKPDLADLCVIRMSEIFRPRTVLTVDTKDFKVYRRNRLEKIPFLSPKS
jgi:predicted nucleic acid-binding protein